jgi:hypothetical protein
MQFMAHESGESEEEKSASVTSFSKGFNDARGVNEAQVDSSSIEIHIAD